MNLEDRLQRLRNQSLVTGIDFVEVISDQLTLSVYFLPNNAPRIKPLIEYLKPSNIHIFSQSTTNQKVEIPVDQLAWEVINERDVLKLTMEHPGDFSLYTLFIDDPKDPPRIDLYFNKITFSFKADCPSDFDCKPPKATCPPEDEIDFPINYLARDFWSFRQALFDYVSTRYPDNPTRLEASFWVMFAEVLSAAGDELSYRQDQISRQAFLATATQRRSLKYLADLVDYQIGEATGASVWLDIQVKEDEEGDLPAGMDVWAIDENGVQVNFELGSRLKEVKISPDKTKKYFVSHDRNLLEPHIWDEDDTCLPVGTTEMYLSNNPEDISKKLEDILLPLTDELPGQPNGMWMLLKVDDPRLTKRRHLIRVIEVQDLRDPVLDLPITRIKWQEEQALPFQMDLRSLKVSANIVPASAGKTYQTYFVTGTDPEDLRVSEDLRSGLARAIEREGANQSRSYLYSVPGSDIDPLVWFYDESNTLRPEILLNEVDPVTGMLKQNLKWICRRSLLGDFTSESLDRDFVVEPGLWRRVVGYRRKGREIIHEDYASNLGHTLRFGDGTFGLIPDEGTIFQLVYRLGAGQATNVAADTITYFDDPQNIIQSITNPLPACCGQDSEPVESIKQFAPEMHKSVKFNAVKTKHYAEAAERLSWVQQAGAQDRWTGSWPTTFVTPDPLGAVSVTDEQRSGLFQQLDRFRMVGREVHVMDPVYANLDFRITICVVPDAIRGEVKERVLQMLFGQSGVRSYPGYFSPDQFTFGTRLYRSSLEAAIQSVEGVRAIENIIYRRRGWFNWQALSTKAYDPGKSTIIRVVNNPNYPERGSVRLLMNGGT